MLRILTGGVLLVILWASVIPSPPVVFTLLMMVVVSLGCLEASAMMDALGLKVLRPLILMTTWGVIGAAAFDPPLYAAALPLAIGTIAITVVAMGTRATPLEMLKSAGGSMLPVSVGFLLSYAVVLRNQPDVGRQLLVLLFLAVIAGDTAAFYVGRRFGRHKMAPSVSPKKTWEGAAGGVFASVAAVLLLQRLWFPQLPLVHAAVLGGLLSTAGILGDLAESLIKRASGVKDSSGLLPGHGGILDRLDSLIFTSPILYYYYHYFVTLR